MRSVIYRGREFLRFTEKDAKPILKLARFGLAGGRDHPQILGVRILEIFPQLHRLQLLSLNHQIDLHAHKMAKDKVTS